MQLVRWAKTLERCMRLAGTLGGATEVLRMKEEGGVLISGAVPKSLPMSVDRHQHFEKCDV